MYPRQIKRKRPTLETAHAFYREGGFYTGPEHRLTGPEREAELEAVSEDLRTIVKRRFPRTGILEYAVLKAHLIMEHAISQYIRCFALTFVEMKSSRFNFSEKVEIAYLMGFGANHPTLLPTVERLNKIRNQVAHEFEMDRAALDEMLRVNSDDYDFFKVASDRERIRLLRNVCAGLCGLISGIIIGTYAFVARETRPFTRAKNGG